MGKNCKYLMEVEQLMVVIDYDYIEGSKGDYWTPPTPDDVRIKSWRLLNGEKSERASHPSYDDEEWEQWMDDIDAYVWQHSAEEIMNSIEFWKD